MGENTITNLVTFASILQQVEKDHRISFIQYNKPVKLCYPNIPKLYIIDSSVLNDNRCDLQHEYLAQLIIPVAQNHKLCSIIDDTFNLVNQLLQKNQEVARAKKSNLALLTRSDSDNSNLLVINEP